MEKKVTLESLDASLGKSLKADLDTQKSQGLEFTAALRRIQVNLSEFRAEMVDSLDDLKLQQKTMTAALMEALHQLNFSRTFERRLTRLEEAVFGKAD